MKNYYSIGELAGYQNISKQTLIFYDKIGLFRPAYVDPSNGYRYYSPKQIDFLDTILIMKKIGFSLEEIREHMKNYNLENSTTLLRGQMEVLDEQIRELRMIRSRLLQRCNMMDEARKYHKNPIVREEVKEQYILCHPVAEPYSLSEVSIATKQCFAQAEEEGLPIFFQTGVINPLQHIQQGRYMETTWAFLPVEKGAAAENIKKLPAGECISIYHFGSYDTIADSYQKLLEYCRQKNLRILSDAYEFCINDYITSSDVNEYITKIQFYLRYNISE